ncbi:hypothetical protein [Spiroplasma sp. BIUS-1]|uniref:hypothetical protein n=1 Tax=Spiroplasma sp. BIUS-1 TaxID=216964 RepID=UPI001396E4A0|nr:hypothetical protein [Spiroplasma sp. BIUS-1]QHX36759.1 hypothetical protein SBIUS_v1c05060 [Spiroplasma sp. BIUS-1]
MIQYSSNKEKIINDLSNKSLKDIFDSLYSNSNQKEIEAWQNSLNNFLEVINISNINNEIKIYLEYKFKFNDSRCDIIMTGKQSGVDKVLVIELKQHDWIMKYNQNDILLFNSDKQPSYLARQLKRYTNSFETFWYRDPFKTKPIIQGLAYLHNMEKETLEKNNLVWNENNWTVEDKTNKLFIKNEHKQFANFLESFFENCCESNFIEEFDKVKKTNLSNNLEIIKNKTNETEIVLTQDQYKVVKNILSLIEKSKNEKTLIYINSDSNSEQLILIYYLYLYFRNNQKYKNSTYLMTKKADYLKELNQNFHPDFVFRRSSTILNLNKNENNIILFDKIHHIKPEEIKQAFEISNIVISTVSYLESIYETYEKLTSVQKVAYEFLENQKAKKINYEFIGEREFNKNLDYIKLVENIYFSTNQEIDCEKTNLHIFKDLSEYKNFISEKQKEEIKFKEIQLYDSLVSYSLDYKEEGFDITSRKCDFVGVKILNDLELIKNSNYLFESTINNMNLYDTLKSSNNGAAIYCQDIELYNRLVKKINS